MARHKFLASHPARQLYTLTMRDADTTAGLPPPPVPPQERPTKPVPQNIADLLVIVRILLGYGLHLAETLDRRAASAQLLRYRAVLRHRPRPRPSGPPRPRPAARHGAGGTAARPRRQGPRPGVLQAPRPAPAPPPRAHAAAPAPAGTRATAPGRPRPAPDEAPDPDHLPTVAQLRARMRGRPVGQALADICRDLAHFPQPV